MKKVYILFLLFLSFLIISPEVSAQTVNSSKFPEQPQWQWKNEFVSSTEASDGGSVPGVAYGTGKYGIVFDDTRDGNYEIYFSLLKHNGKKIGTDLRITNDPGASRDPTIIWNGRTFGIFWYDNFVGSQRGIYYASISPKGKLEIGPVRINDALSNGVHPSAVWNKKTKEYGVVWWDSRIGGTYFARVDRQGNVILETPVSTLGPSGYYRPLIAAAENEYALVWGEPVPCASGSCPEMAFAKVDFNGIKIGDDEVITSYGATRAKTIVWNGSEYGVLIGLGHYASLLKLTSNGEIIGSPVSLGLMMMANARMVWNGRNYGITWIDDQWKTPEYPDNSEVAFRTFDKNGNPLKDIVRVSYGTESSWNSSFPIWNGGRFAVVWVENLYQPDQVIYFAQGK